MLFQAASFNLPSTTIGPVAGAMVNLKFVSFDVCALLESPKTIKKNTKPKGLKILNNLGKVLITQSSTIVKGCKYKVYDWIIITP